MEFRKGRRNKTPLEYLQRRIRVAYFLFPHLGDTHLFIYKVLRAIPSEWRTTLSDQVQANVYELEFAANNFEKPLISLWELHNQSRGLSNPQASANPSSNQDRRRRWLTSGDVFTCLPFSRSLCSFTPSEAFSSTSWQNHKDHSYEQYIWLHCSCSNPNFIVFVAYCSMCSTHL